MRNSRLLLIFILLLTLIAVFINLPKEFTIGGKKYSTYKPDIALGPLKLKTDFPFSQGLDLSGGTSITLRADMKDIPATRRDDALNSAKNVIERRVNFFGVSEPVVQTSRANQDYRIIVEIPGVTDVNQAVRLIGTTAKLEFWETGASGSAELTDLTAYPAGVPQILGPNAKKTNLTGEDLQQSAVTFDPNTGKPQVQLTFTPEGSRKFADITRKNVGKPLAIILDNIVVEAPRVNEAITGGSAVITGEFNTDTAKTLSVQLNAGALPVSLSVLEQRAIGATLGEESLQKSLIAGIIGFIVIVIFMVALYGWLGVVASIALLLYSLFVLVLFRLIPVTMTLAGIAGFILSIGIAVDANILIFERMKEELRRGKSRGTAMELGFNRAWPSIRDSNIASLITSSILYYFGTGIVRGFALTLAIGVFVSMFSAITVTRTILRMVYKN